jgi:hypothetical protein
LLAGRCCPCGAKESRQGPHSSHSKARQYISLQPELRATQPKQF